MTYQLVPHKISWVGNSNFAVQALKMCIFGNENHPLLFIVGMWALSHHWSQGSELLIIFNKYRLEDIKLQKTDTNVLDMQNKSEPPNT